MTLITPLADGVAALDMDDVVLRGMTVTLEGQPMWPPPEIPVSAIPVQQQPQPQPSLQQEAADRTRLRSQRTAVAGGLAAILVVLALTWGPASFLGHFTVFALAVIIGYYVITGVSHSLHTPLMAQTNAISGIILVGALLQLGHRSLLVTVLAFIAATVASINIFGGFLVSRRMINMFSKDG
jgi:NAD(P) transhydrogenase subunit alpha